MSSIPFFLAQDASDEEKLALLCAHPDLAGRAAMAGDLTAESTEEQAKAGLDKLSPEEMAKFTVGEHRAVCAAGV